MYMKHTALLISLLAALSLSSCINICFPTAKGEIVERTATISEEITSVAISSGIDAIVDPTLHRGEVRIITHTDVQELVNIEVKEQTLNISLHPKSLNAEVLEVRIPAYDYHSVAISAGCDFEWACCNVNSLTVAASSGSDVEIKGHCQTLTAAASSGADLDLEELIAESVNVAASSGSDAHVHATTQLIATASSGADITYSGNPTVKEITTSSGADIHKDHE